MVQPFARGKSKANKSAGNGNGNGASAELRLALAQAIAQLRSEQSKLDQLATGRERARLQYIDLTTAITNVANDLAIAEEGETARVAAAFISNGGGGNGDCQWPP